MDVELKAALDDLQAVCAKLTKRFDNHKVLFTGAVSVSVVTTKQSADITGRMRETYSPWPQYMSLQQTQGIAAYLHEVVGPEVQADNDANDHPG